MTEPVRVQVRIRILTREGDRIYKKRGRKQILLDWAATGKTPEGIEITEVTWQNYNRWSEERVADDKKSIELARETLHLAELFSAAFPSFSSVGPSQGARPPAKAPAGHRRRKLPRRKASRKSGTPKSARKSAKHRTHRKSRNRMASHRAKLRRKGLARHRKHTKKLITSRASGRASHLRKRSGKGKA